jgi:hypothetical protein
MSRLGINTGSNPNDGQGDPLRIAMGKINSNFTEIYNTIGDGNNLISYASTAGISTLAQNLTGSPRINVSGVLNSGITTTEHLEVRNITSSGIITAIQFVGDGSQLENVVATSSGVEVLDDNVRKGIAKELNFGQGVFCSGPDGVGRVTIAITTSIVSGGGTGSSSLEIRNQNVILGEFSKLNFGQNLYAYVDPTVGVVTVTTAPGGLNISGVVTATSFVGNGSGLTGISTFSGNYNDLTNKPSIPSIVGLASEGYVDSAISGLSTLSGDYTVNRLGVSSSLSVSGVSSFYNNVNIESDRAILIGDNDELQLFHSGVDSYIDNNSAGNLIIRDSGIGIQLRRSGGGPGAGLMAAFNNNAGVELYYNSVLKLETFENGVAINDSVGIGTTAGNPPYRLTVSGVGATITSGLVNAIADLTSSVDGYGQVNIRNSRSAPYASGDLVITANTGTDSSNYIDLGINNTGFSTSTWTINGALDGYLYASDGNLSIGAASSSKYLSLFAGGTLAANEQVRVTTSGVGIGTTNSTSKLTVRGGDISVGINTSHGVILTSPNGTQYRLIVDDSGNLSTVLVP